MKTISYLNLRKKKLKIFKNTLGYEKQTDMPSALEKDKKAESSNFDNS